MHASPAHWTPISAIHYPIGQWIYVWSVRTGRLLDVLAGHEGPVSQLAFSPGGGPATLLASASWDKTVRTQQCAFVGRGNVELLLHNHDVSVMNMSDLGCALWVRGSAVAATQLLTWDVFSGRGAVESLPHNHDVLALAFAPNGKQLAAATLNGDITFWDPHEALAATTFNGGISSWDLHEAVLVVSTLLLPIRSTAAYVAAGGSQPRWRNLLVVSAHHPIYHANFDSPHSYLALMPCCLLTCSTPLRADGTSGAGA
eukprot:scaffold109768_cov17-Tisochrysis_lutea.AAC.1